MPNYCSLFDKSGRFPRVVILFFCCMPFFSCERESLTPVDEIHYTDIVPDKEFHTVRSFSPSLVSVFSCSDIPEPADSSVTFDLDINNDSISDFRINASHRAYTDGYCGHCSVFTYNIYIEGCTDQDSIACTEQIWIARLFNSGDSIQAKNTWSPRAELVLLEGCALPFQTDFDRGYIGVKTGSLYGYIHVEKMPFHGIRILEFGFNASENRSIVCGQQ
ncbi:MAG TPA: hypothetical protein PLK12_17165 [Prolixibacteraceae bacterium]|nr:hypothetical protein [Prolixibacteraceae bacterium]